MVLCQKNNNNTEIYPKNKTKQQQNRAIPAIPDWVAYLFLNITFRKLLWSSSRGGPLKPTFCPSSHRLANRYITHIYNYT